METLLTIPRAKGAKKKGKILWKPFSNKESKSLSDHILQNAFEGAGKDKDYKEWITAKEYKRK